jgi:hypothetical protein
LHKASAGAGPADQAFAVAARDLHNFDRLKTFENLDLRLLEDVLSPSQSGYFMAAIRGKKDGHLVFTLDPHGARHVSPEEISLLNWSDWGASYPLAFHLSSESTSNGGNGNEQDASYRIDNESLDVSIEKNGFLSGTATVHILALQDGVAVVPLSLYPTLRVSRVETDLGESLDFVQEKKEEDEDFGVVLKQPLKNGESATVKVAYAGKDVVANEGGQNYYPIAREVVSPCFKGIGRLCDLPHGVSYPQGT